jgi:predicted nucleotidyltransferase
MFALPNEQFEAMLPDIVRRLHAEFGECAIYLFGSRADGNARPGSDIDLLIVLPPGRAAEGEANFALAGRAYNALRGVAAPKDILVYTAAQFAERSSWRGSFESVVARKGRLLHAA